MTVLFYVLIVVNVAVFLMYLADKRAAINGKWRISEKMLLAVSALGPVGAYFGMNVFHHKTNKKKFSLGVIFMIIGWLVLLSVLMVLKK